jgi:hypothetical protein
MAKNLENLARRLVDDPLFVACPLALYAKSERLDEESFASRLRCTVENFALVCLCRAPAAESESFQDDIAQIAAKFSVDADTLLEAIRRGQAIYQMSRNAASDGTLLAARDGKKKRTGEKGDNS